MKIRANARKGENKMLSCEGIGKNIEQAIENALFELKAPREDVDIKILDEGGFFRKAKVLVSISEDAKEKYIKKEEKIKTEEIKETQKTEVKEDKKIEKVKKVKLEKVDKEIVAEVKNDENIEEEGMDPMEFLKGLFEVAGKDVEINVTEDDNYITYSVEGENLGDMIGHRGDSYYAINRILTAVVGRQEKKVLLDIGGYRRKREEVLTSLAKRTADRVAKSGRYSRLDPMNPSERRVIHSALAEDNRVVTLSKGEEPHRYVMIFPKGEND